jgi:HEAT repeats
MTDDSYDPAIPARSGGANPPDDTDLPPVQPPSAGFIIQLFLVPGLIVLVVVGVWALFGKMASGEQSWRRLVEEMKQTNPHRRWRGAMGLAQLLQADQQQGAEGERLAENPEVATALADMFREQLESKSRKPDDVSQQAFLARALGMLDAHDVVLPALQQAMRPAGDAETGKEIRKNAIASVAVIAGRAKKRDAAGDPSIPGPRLRKVVEFASLLDDVEAVSRDDDPLIRQLGAFTLGLLPSPRSRQRLEVLLADPDEKTRLNAAIGLARQNSTKGLPVFESVLRSAGSKEQESAREVPGEKKAQRYFWIGIAVAALFVFAVWGAGTTRRGSRIVAALLSLAALIAICYGIYELVHDRPTSDAVADASLDETDPAAIDGQDGPAATHPSGVAVVAGRRKAALASRFEQLVSLRNTLKAVADLAPRYTAAEKTRLRGLVQPVAETYFEPSIRIDAKRALLVLK